MTFAQQLRQEGLQQGLQQGMQQGLHRGEALFLENLLKNKFSHVSEKHLQFLRNASEAQLMEWGKRLLIEQTLEEVFG